MLDKLTTIAAETNTMVMLYNGSYGKDWTITIEREDEGTKLTVKTHSDNMMEAVTEAVTKWTRITEAALPEFAGPLLEAPKSDFHRELNDEIPF